jgi:hypothetical protein
MRPEGQPPSSRIVRGFLPSPRHRGRGAMTASARQRSPKECRICRSRLPIRDLAITPPQPLRWPAALPAHSKERGRRPQRPGNQPRSRAWLDVSPATRFHELPAAAGSAAIIGKVRNSHVSLEPTLRHFVASRNLKSSFRCAETVDDVTSLWKNEEI